MRFLRLVACLLLWTSAACHGSSTVPTPALELTGEWRGLIGKAGSGTALRATWTAHQIRFTAVGPALLQKPTVDLTFAGTLTATLAGTQLSLVYSAPRGSITGYPGCSISGTGSAAATATAITGTMSLTLSSCGDLGVLAATDAPVTLLR